MVHSRAWKSWELSTRATPCSRQLDGCDRIFLLRKLDGKLREFLRRLLLGLVYVLTMSLPCQATGRSDDLHAALWSRDLSRSVLIELSVTSSSFVRMPLGTF